MGKEIIVVICEPGKAARAAKVKNDLATLQTIVKGYIEAYRLGSGDLIICNDEGKFNGSAPCRGVYDDNNELLDIIYGKFLICGQQGENFGSLSEEKQKEYLERFGDPEHFFRVGNKIKTVKYKEGNVLKTDKFNK